VKLLIIEDDTDLNKSIADYLVGQHYLCETVTNFKEALAKIEDYDYDCVIIDLTLPGGDGLLLLSELKRNGKTDGVIIISARNELEDKILGLSLGADDYLTKPFHLSELSVRIAAIIRRKNLQGSNKVVFEEIAIDVMAQTADVNKKVVQLTRKEYDLLLFFVINRGRVLSKNAIASHLWGDDMDLADNYDFIYTHIKNLRKKLLNAGANDYVQSVYGMGYKFTVK
jgi:DNA-binding response OmpR family regulator